MLTSFVSRSYSSQTLRRLWTEKRRKTLFEQLNSVRRKSSSLGRDEREALKNKREAIRGAKISSSTRKWGRRKKNVALSVTGAGSLRANSPTHASQPAARCRECAPCFISGCDVHRRNLLSCLPRVADPPPLFKSSLGQVAAYIIDALARFSSRYVSHSRARLTLAEYIVARGEKKW